MEQPVTYKTLRDEMAMAVLACVLPEMCRRAGELLPEDTNAVAHCCYKVADQMLKAREVE